MSKTTILPPAMLGMLGGGQLGRFFVNAAHEMGYRVTVLDPGIDCPAGKVADVHLCANYDDPSALQELAASCAAITTEFENVPAATLQRLARDCVVRPAAAAVAVAQQRVAEKTFLRDAGLPTADFVAVEQVADLPPDGSPLYPSILKVARFGYDGKGQARVDNREQAEIAFANFGSQSCVLEQRLKLDYEMSVVLARDAKGNISAFTPAENQHRDGILDVSIAPARAPAAILAQAEAEAVRVAEKLNYVGVLGVEFFVADGRLLVNEIAPRPHNSGHYTIDACVTSQFEQQVRVLTGLPLGDGRLHSHAVMVNILGDAWRDGEPDWKQSLSHPNLKMHLYNKREARKGRKMGHFTVLAADGDVALQLAQAARAELGGG